MARGIPWTPGPEESGWAGRLAPDGGHVAFLIAPDAVRYAIGAASPVFDLLDGVWHAHPDRAHGLLRRRLFTTAPRDPADHALVQVCGRKLGAGVPRGVPRPADRPTVDLTTAAAASRAHHLAASAIDAPARFDGSDAEVAARLRALAHREQHGPRATRDRAVVALLIGPDGAVLEAARNTHGTHRLRHAEVNLIQRWGAPIPADARVLVSTQCCRMCAALLARAAADPRALDVRYADPEPGRFGQQTALQALGVERPLDHGA